jgi:hypothetical protein
VEKISLNSKEMALIKKLCQPNPFMPTFPESVMPERFKIAGIVEVHQDGSVEVTDFGADCYIATVHGEN